MGNCMKETWESVVGYEGLYEISNYGDVKSLARFKCKKDRILKPGKDSDGYLQFTLRKNNKPKTFKVYKLVLEAFIGPCPPGMQRCHNDGNKENNFVENLRYDTQSGNMQDKNRHGTMSNQKGSKNNNSELNELRVRVIKRLLEDGYLTQREIAKIFDVHFSTISEISRNKNWKHIKQEV